MGALSLLCKSETTDGASTREPGEGAWQEQHGLRRGLLDGLLSKNEADTERGGVGSGEPCPRIGELVGMKKDAGCPPSAALRHQ